MLSTISATLVRRASDQPQGHLFLPSQVQGIRTKGKSLIEASTPWKVRSGPWSRVRV